ncbi:MAG TPA: patatin-like phospholipase family protein [Candidatus Dormibacteraeota bacterium]
MPEPLLHWLTPVVDRSRVGISYSAGGALLLVELGIAQAFIELGVRPAAIAGVSAGAIAGTAHALDPVDGEGIAAAARALASISNRRLGLTPLGVVWRAIMQRRHLASLGDNAAIEGLLADGFRRLTGSDRLTFGRFGRDGRPKLIVGAADRLQGEPVWFPDDSDVAEALVASSAIPGLFPPRRLRVAGLERLLVDGSVVGDQPISALALDGCGTIYACAVGYDGERLAAPGNLVDNALRSLSILRHQAARLEQEYVQLRMGDRGVIHHIHPEVVFPVKGFNFTPDLITRVMRDACEATKRWLTQQRLLP